MGYPWRIGVVTYQSACQQEVHPMSPSVALYKEERSSASANHGVPRWATGLLLIAVLLPAIISFGVLCRQSLSVPYQDDYNAILAFAIKYEHQPNLRGRVLEIAAAQHNEYKLGFEHAIVASDLELNHHLNFGFLVALGDSFLLGIGYLLWKTYSSEDQDLSLRLLKFLPISLIFFSLTYWETLNWAMAGLQNTPVIFFSLLALYLLIPVRQDLPSASRMLAACVMAALAALTSANGFLLAAVGLLFLLPRRAYGRSLVWCASFITPFATYLYHYDRHASHSLHKLSFMTRPYSFVAFLGCAIPPRWADLLVGLAILASVPLAIRSRFDRIRPVAFYFAAWLMATALMVAWVRGADNLGVSPRYSLYSVLLLIFCYSFLGQYLPNRLPNLDRKVFYAASLVCAFGIFLIADARAYMKLGARRQMVLMGIEHYRAAHGMISPMIDPEVDKYFPKERAFERVILTNAIQMGIYALPTDQTMNKPYRGLR
jgi:hypothetical protein